MPQILAFGDSITYGLGDSEGGWVERLRKYVDEKGKENPDYFSVVYNLGVSGDTTRELLARFQAEADERHNRGELSTIIFAFGANDSKYLVDEKNNLVPPEEFEDNLKKIITLAKGYGSQIFFFGITPVDEKKLESAPWRTFHVHKNEYIRKYNDILKSFCGENNILFVDIYNLFLSQEDYTGLLSDGLHPNDEGHKLIFETVRDCLEQKELI